MVQHKYWMRHYISLVENMFLNEQSEPYISAHKSGNDTVWIDMMQVPANQRMRGVGRQYYEQWEANLPKEIKLVRLMAADTGGGLSNRFWENMGFEYQYNGENMPYEVSQYMWKGVNGHPTPPTEMIDD